MEAQKVIGYVQKEWDLQLKGRGRSIQWICSKGIGFIPTWRPNEFILFLYKGVGLIPTWRPKSFEKVLKKTLI